MRFSLVIPCYNEAANLPLLLERCKELAVTPDVEVVLVDNGSTDNTAEVLENLLPKFPRCRSIRVDKNQGYGFGIVSGLKADVVFTIGMSVFETFLLARPMWDINAQPTMFSRRFFESWTDPPDDFSLDLYAYFQAQTCGLKVHRFPVRFGERAHGVSHWNVNWAAKRKFIRRTVNFSLQLKKKIST